MQEEFLALVARGTRARLRRLPLLARARRGPAGLRPGRDHPRWPAGRGGARCRAARQDASAGLGRVRRAGRPQWLRALPGVGDLEAVDGRVPFKVAGDLDPVVKAIARHTVIDLEIARPTLEEVFLTYYAGGDALSVPDRRAAATNAAGRCSPGACRSASGRPSSSRSTPRSKRADEGVRSYPTRSKEAFGSASSRPVEQYLHAEMLSLIVPLAVGYLAVRALASGLSGAAESGRLDVLLSAPVSRRRLVPAAFCADRRRVGGRPRHHPLLTLLGSLLSGAGLVRRRAGRLSPTSGRWRCLRRPGDRRHGFSLRTSVVTGSVAGVLVGCTCSISSAGSTPASTASATPRSSATTATRSRTGSNPLAFIGVTAAAVALAALGSALFERRDLFPG